MNMFNGLFGLAVSLFVLPLVALATTEPQAKKTEPPQAQTLVQEKLLALDLQLSHKADQEGILPAFFPLLTQDAVLFPINGHPLCGSAACAELIKKYQASNNIIKGQWQPLGAGLSANEDLAYTYGRYQRGNAELEHDNKIAYRYYATIWKKNQAGEWQIAVSLGLLDYNFFHEPPLDMAQKVDITKVNAITAQVVQTEYDFARLAKEKGNIEAFYHYIADTGIALSFDGPPNTKESYGQNLAQPTPNKPPEDKRPILAWEPFYSFVAGSEDLAYNFGPYTFTAYDQNGQQHLLTGYFVTVWQRQPDNSWRFLLDGGNTCIQPE